MSKTMLQHFDGLPARVEPIRGERDAGVQIRQENHLIDITSTEPAWLEELESAVRMAREHLESLERGRLVVG